MKIAVVGAGIAGLVCAYELQRAGHEVIVFESASQVGGRMATRSHDSLPFDIGANHLANVYTEMQHYCRELNLDWIPMDIEKYGLAHDGVITPLGSVANWLDKLRLALAYKKIPKDSSLDFFDLSTLAQFDDSDAYSVMEKTLGTNLTEYLVDSFTSTYQFHGAREISRSAMVGIMQSIKYHGPDWKLHRLAQGMSTLPEALAKHLTVKLETPVTSIKPYGQQVTVTTSAGDTQYNAVVMACPAPVTAQVYQSPTPAQADLLRQTNYAATIAVAYTLPADQLPDYSIVWVPFAVNQHISGYTNEMMKGVPMLCVWLHEDYAQQLLDKSDAEIYSTIKQEITNVAPWLDNAAVLKNYDIQRWPNAMPKFAQGHITRVAKFMASPDQGAQRVWLCGDYLNSPWTEGALRCGQRVAKQILNQSTVT